MYVFINECIFIIKKKIFTGRAEISPGLSIDFCWQTIKIDLIYRGCLRKKFERLKGLSEK